MPKKAETLVPLSEYKKLKKWFEQEIKRKDKLIEELKKENLALLKVSLKRSKEREEMHEKMKK